jgi:tetratricopeptide (TPR) repeat protein
MKIHMGAMAGVVLAVAILGQAVADVPRADDAVDSRIAKLIEQLGDNQFAVRQRAQQELVKLGFDAFDALSDAEMSDDPEIAMQAGYLVRQIRAEWTRDGDPRQVQQILKDFDAQPDDRRLLKIKQLADLPSDQGLDWLCRLVRFEKSPVLSKQAALAIIGQPLSRDDAPRRGATITGNLARARRPAAKWLLAYAQSLDDPTGALDKWTALTDAERQTLDQHPQETQNQIVMELLKRKIDLLDRLGRSAETTDAMHQMALVERGDSASLTELIEWLVKRKAWPVVHEVATRFSASFEADAMLLYTLCEAHLAEGHRDVADQLAEKALKLNGDSPQEHLAAAHALKNRGLVDWADREWRHTIALGPVGSQADVDARRYLAERLHDQLLDLEAAQLIKGLLDAADADANVMQRLRSQTQQGETSPNMLRATMHYYLACQAASQKDLAGQRQNLDKALQQDHKNIEALIALYQLTGNEPQKRAELVKLVKEVMDDCRAKIEDAAEEHPYYNQYVSNYDNQIAWLIANTEGDVDEAIRLSHKSIELARAAGEGKSVGGLLDTLGHCYYAKKDYANAVKYQSEAAALDPHTQAIGRQLKVFREALEQQQSGAK